MEKQKQENNAEIIGGQFEAGVIQKPAGIEDRIKISKATQCLHILGEAYRADWSNLDGRELREQLAQIIGILEGSSITPKEFMEKNDIVEDAKYKGVYKWKE